jgi:hypothetical protein
LRATAATTTVGADEAIRRSGRMRLGVIGFSVLVVAIAAAACGGQTIKQEAEPVTVTVTETVGAGEGTSTAVETTTEEESDSGQAGIGDTITLHGYEEGEELQVTVRGLIDPAKSDPYFGPRRGHKWVAVNLVLKNTGSKAYNDSPGNGAQLIDTSDEGYDEAGSETPSCHYMGYSVKIASGSKRAGCLVFEVKKAAKPVVFQFTMDSGFADETGEWTLR